MAPNIQAILEIFEVSSSPSAQVMVLARVVSRVFAKKRFLDSYNLTSTFQRANSQPQTKVIIVNLPFQNITEFNW